MSNGLFDAITEEEAEEFYEEFLQALQSGDIKVLKKMYADDYILVRPNGDTLRKSEILEDLQHGRVGPTRIDWAIVAGSDSRSGVGA